MSVTSKEMAATTYVLIQLVPIIVPAEMGIIFTKMEKVVWVRLFVHVFLFFLSLQWLFIGLIELNILLY